MQVQINLTANNKKELRFLNTVLEMVASSADGDTVTVTTIDKSLEPKKGPGRPKAVAAPVDDEDDEPVKPAKKKAKAPIVEDDEEEEDDSDADEEDDTEEDDEEEEDEKPAKGKKAKEEPKAKGTTQKQMIANFKAYSDENGRPAALKILKKFGVKSVLELKDDIYPKVLKALKA